MDLLPSCARDILQEVSTLREELSRLRRQAEDDRRRAVYAESEKEKAVSLGREGRLSLEKDLATAKVQCVMYSG